MSVVRWTVQACGLAWVVLAAACRPWPEARDFAAVRGRPGDDRFVLELRTCCFGAWYDADRVARVYGDELCQANGCARSEVEELDHAPRSIAVTVALPYTLPFTAMWRVRAVVRCVKAR